MRIGQRLGLGFGIILLLMIGTAVFISLSLNRIGKVQKVVAIHIANIKTFDALKGVTEQWLMTTEYIINNRNLSILDYHEILKASIEKKLKEIDWDVYERTTKSLRDEIVQGFQSIKKLDNTVQMYLRLGKEAAPEIINMDNAIFVFEADASRITRILADLKEMLDTAYTRIITYSKKTEKRGWLSIYIVVPVTIIFSIIYAFFITRGITKPLKILGMATKKVAEGSYDAKWSIKSSVEIDELFNAFNSMSLKLNESNNRLMQSYNTIKEQRDFLDTILTNTKDMIVVTDKENKVEYMNKAALMELGNIIGKYCYQSILNRELPCQQCSGKELLRETLKMEQTIKEKVYDSVIVPLIKSTGDISKMEIFRDITDAKQFQDELERLSVTDKLTGLYNRRYFDEILEKEVSRAKRLKHDLSLLFIDMDKFKHFNDTYGHPAGDKVLQQLGKLMKEQLRNGIDTVCRYGGEEFTIVLPETSSLSAVTIAERILKDFRETKFHIPFKDETVQKTISIGISELSSSPSARALLVNADSAMYEAKKLGGNRVCEYRA